MVDHAQGEQHPAAAFERDGMGGGLEQVALGVQVPIAHPDLEGLPSEKLLEGADHGGGDQRI